MTNPTNTALHANEWEIAFKAAIAEPRFYKALRRFAGNHARRAHRRAIGDGYADDLVQEAIELTWRGIRRWDPAAMDLAGHLRSVIRSCAGHAAHHFARFRHVRLDEIPRVADPKAGENYLLRRRARDALAAVRRLADDDPGVQLLLDAFQSGYFHRDQVIEFTGFTRLEYEAARKQLDRMRDDIPNKLHSNR